MKGNGQKLFFGGKWLRPHCFSFYGQRDGFVSAADCKQPLQRQSHTADLVLFLQSTTRS